MFTFAHFEGSVERNEGEIVEGNTGTAWKASRIKASAACAIIYITVPSPSYLNNIKAWAFI